MRLPPPSSPRHFIPKVSVPEAKGNSLQFPRVLPIGLSRLSTYAELTKPELTGLSALTSVFAYVLAADSQATWLTAAMVGSGTLLVGGGAGALNQLIERRFDAMMKRTEHRPLPSGRVRALETGAFGVLLALAGALLLWIEAGPLPSFISLLTLALYLGIYTPLKRKTWLNTVFGTIPGALPALIGWTAAETTPSAGGWFLFLFLVIWQFPHFFSLAWMYRKDYERAGYHMLSVQDTENAHQTHRINLLSTLSLLPVVSIFFYYESTGPMAIPAAVSLTLWFVSISAKPIVRGLTNTSTTRTINADSRNLFFASLLYLPLVMILGLVSRA